MSPKVRNSLIGMAVLAIAMILAAPFAEPPKTGTTPSGSNSGAEKAPSGPISVAASGDDDAQPVVGERPTSSEADSVNLSDGSQANPLRVQTIRRQSCRERCAGVDGRLKRQCMEGCSARKVVEACRTQCSGGKRHVWKLAPQA